MAATSAPYCSWDSIVARFSPLLLPPELDFSALFHGVDERVPVDGLKFGARVLDRFLMSC